MKQRSLKDVASTHIGSIFVSVFGIFTQMVTYFSQ